MKQIYLSTLFLLPFFAFSQVGVNTDDPQAMLDVDGNMKVRTVPAVTTIDEDDHPILLRDATATGDDEIKEISARNLFTNTSVYAGENDGAWDLLNLGISGTNWNKISLTGADYTLGNPTLFNEGIYTAPETGIYAVHYEFQLEGGVNLNLLGNKQLGLLKGTTVVEQKLFDAVRVSLLGVTLAAVPVTSTSLDALVHLNAGETLTFAVETGGAILGLLTDNKVSVSIYRISY